MFSICLPTMWAIHETSAEHGEAPGEFKDFQEFKEARRINRRALEVRASSKAPRYAPTMLPRLP